MIKVVSQPFKVIASLHAVLLQLSFEPNDFTIQIEFN